MRNDIVQVITEYKEKAEIKNVVKEIYAEKKSTTRSEFYAAYASGLAARYVFEMDPDDFEACDVKIEEDDRTIIYHPSHIRHCGERFEIVRAFAPNPTSIEITVK